MDKDELEREIIEFAKHDIEAALSLIGGMFLALNYVYVELRGGDSKKQIVISGDDGQRKITIDAETGLKCT